MHRIFQVAYSQKIFPKVLEEDELDVPLFGLRTGRSAKDPVLVPAAKGDKNSDLDNSLLPDLTKPSSLQRKKP